MSHPLGRSKQHIEIQLPFNNSYQTGDYLTVLPVNSSEKVNEVLKFFSLDPAAEIVLKDNSGPVYCRSITL